MKQKKHSVDGFVQRRYETSELGDRNRADADTTIGHVRPETTAREEELHSGVDESAYRQDVGGRGGIKEAIGASLKAIDSDTEQKKQHKKKKRTVRKRLKWASLLIGLIILLIGGFLLVKAWQVGSRMFQGNMFGIFQRQQLKMDAHGRSNALILGSTDDMAGRDGANLTDSMMVVSVNQEKKDAYMFSIPRDLWVDYDKACESGLQGKINAYYACSAPGEGKEAEMARMEATKNFVGDLFGMEIHYVAHINTVVIRDGVDAVGGITVNVESNDPRGVRDSTFDDMCDDAPNLCPSGHFMDFKKGQNKMNGTQAMTFLQARGLGAQSYGFEGNNFSRERNQQLVLMALKEKATSSGTFTDITKVMGLMDAMGDNLRTNVDSKEIQSGLALATEIKTENIHRLSFVDEDNMLLTDQMIGGQAAIVPVAGTYNYTGIRAFLKETMFATPLTKEGATVLVLNGGGPTGSAQKEADRIGETGLNVVDVANSPETESGTYALYQITDAENPLTKAKLEELYGVTAKTSPPPFVLPVVADFVLVIGEKAPAGV